MGQFIKDDSDKDVYRPQGHAHGFWGTAGLMILGFILAALSWIGKPLFTWLFDFNQITPKLAKIKVGVIVTLFGGTALILYQVPFLKDMATLSSLHTINLGAMSDKTPFPDRSYFVTESSLRVITLEKVSGITYTTYSPQYKNIFTALPANNCQMIPRGEKMSLASSYAIVSAVGLKDKVRYSVLRNYYLLPFRELLIELFINPKLFFTSKETKREMTIEYIEEASWREFSDDVNYGKVKRDENSMIMFEVEARGNEHALICTGS